MSQQPVVVQQQMMSQQELLNQQMLQMQQLQLANQQRLLHQSQPVLNGQHPQQQVQRPMSQQAMSTGTNYQYHAQTQPSTQPTQHVPVQAQHVPVQAQQVPVQAQQVPVQAQQVSVQAQQTYQQNGIQYVQMSNGMLVPVVAQQQTQQVTSSNPSEPKNVSSSSVNKHHYSSIQEAKAESKSKSAQKAQLHMSQDAGLKCSQI